MGLEADKTNEDRAADLFEKVIRKHLNPDTGAVGTAEILSALTDALDDAETRGADGCWASFEGAEW